MNKTHKCRDLSLSRDLTGIQLILLQLAITLQPCELPLGLTVANLDQETTHLITFPATDHLLRMWKVTPCSPQPQDT